MIAHIIPYTGEATRLLAGGRPRRIGRGSVRVGSASGVMDRFVSHYTLRLDAKGRVSIPASFRAVLARDGFDGLYCYPALDRPALDAGGNALLKEIETLIARFAPYSEEREQFSATLYSTSEILKIDGEGRVVLTEPLKIACGHRGRGRVRGPRPQVSDLGAGTLPRGTRGGHREGPRAQEAAWHPGSGGRSARSAGMTAGRGGGQPLPMADWPVTFPCSAARRSSSSRPRRRRLHRRARSAPAATRARSSQPPTAR